MRILSYDPNNKPIDGKSMGDIKPLPNDGDHIAYVIEIGEPFKRKKDEVWICPIELGIVGSDAAIKHFIECTADGQWANTWRGLGKWNTFCEALNLKEGNYNDGAFRGSVLCIQVETNGKYKNIKKMWPCSEKETEEAANWMAKQGVI